MGSGPPEGLPVLDPNKPDGEDGCSTSSMSALLGEFAGDKDERDGAMLFATLADTEALPRKVPARRSPAAARSEARL